MGLLVNSEFHYSLDFTGTVAENLRQTGISSGDPETHTAVINQAAAKLRPELTLQINDTLHWLPPDKCVCGTQ